MVKALFDTNILIDRLNNIDKAGAELELYDERAVSIITWIEVMAGAPAEVQSATRAFLSRFQIIGLDEQVADLAVQLRRMNRIKLPEVVIWASARAHGMLLVMRNTTDFPAEDPGVRVPYRR